MSNKHYIITRLDTNTPAVVKEASKYMAMSKYLTKWYKDWHGGSCGNNGLYTIYNDFGMRIEFTISENNH